MERIRPDKSVSAVVRPDFGHALDPFDELSAMLWHERELLEQLLYALVTQQLFLVSRSTRWLVTTDAHVMAAAEALREHGLLRAVVTDDVLRGLQLPAGTALPELADQAPEPWPSILADLHSALSELVAEIDRTSERNSELLVASVRGSDADEAHVDCSGADCLPTGTRPPRGSGTA